MSRATRASTAKDRGDAALKLLPAHLQTQLSASAEVEANTKPHGKPKTRKEPAKPKAVAKPASVRGGTAKKRARAETMTKDSATTVEGANPSESKKVRVSAASDFDDTNNIGDDNDDIEFPLPSDILATLPDNPPLQPRKRKEHPGAPDQPRSKRTSAQVVQNQRELDELEAEAQKLAERRKQMLARMELEQEEEDTKEKQTVVRSFTPFSEDDKNGDGDFDPATVETAPSKEKKKKPKKGETRKAVEEVKAIIAVAKKDQINITVKKTPSTLHPDWESRQPAKIASIPSTKAPANAKASDLYTSFDIGGLGEDEEGDDKPTTTPKPQRGRAKAVVGVISKTPVQSASAVTANRKSIKCEAPTPTPASTRKAKKIIVSNPVSGTVLDRNPFLISRKATDVDTSDLPAFIKGIYQDKYLPVLYTYMHSTFPFGPEFSKGSGLVLTVKNRLGELVPNNTYEPDKDARICSLSYDRLNEKRAHFGSEALKFVREQVSNMTPKQTMDYCNYAMRPNGPALYSTPTPYQCTLTPQHADYVYPKGLGESDAFVTVFGNVVKSSLRDSTLDYGHPVGAFGLTAAALIRAYGFYATGDFHQESKDTFSQVKIGARVQQMMELGRKLSDAAWGRIHTAAGTSPYVDDPAGSESDAMLADHFDEYAFDFHVPVSSPAPGTHGNDSDDAGDGDAGAVEGQ